MIFTLIDDRAQVFHLRSRFVDEAKIPFLYDMWKLRTCRYQSNLMSVTCAENSASSPGGGSSRELR